MVSASTEDSVLDGAIVFRRAAAALSMVLGVVCARGGVDEDFLDPPRAARPYVWWQWMGSNVTDAGIERDVAAMAGSGVGGAVIFSNTAQCGIWAGLTNAVNPALKYRNAEYWRLQILRD